MRKDFSFFDLDELENIKQIDIAFCDCEKYISCVNKIIDSCFINKQEIDTDMINPLKDGCHMLEKKLIKN
ncbi:MAG: hypothetical protein Q8784_01620 [Vigna little leaf phytoplasma]|nr:hypothetical protein [Vigna little leaf phytoplasma]